jgi:glycerol-3-phosphate dehydrogenase
VHLFARGIRKPEETVKQEKTAKQQAAAGGLRGCLALVCPEDTLVRRTALRLLETKDLAAELSAICEEYGSMDFWRKNAAGRVEAD